MYFGDCYSEAFIWTSFLIASEIYLFFNSLRIVRKIHWTMLIFERTFGIFIYFCLFLFPLLIGFTFLANMFYGPYLYGYSLFVFALLECVLTMMGQ